MIDKVYKTFAEYKKDNLAVNMTSLGERCAAGMAWDACYESWLIEKSELKVEIEELEKQIKILNEVCITCSTCGSYFKIKETLISEYSNTFVCIDCCKQDKA